MFDDSIYMMTGSDLSSPSSWNRFEDKLFEQALVSFPDGVPDRWGKIANHVPGKSPTQVREHYEALVHDVLEIDSGRVELPCYPDDSLRCGADFGVNQICFGSKSTKLNDSERKKGIPWTEDEHRLFLVGLNTYGKGDWRSISRNVVVTRTPTQVASHAQKFFLRQGSGKKERKRSSIHDITTADNKSMAQGWNPSPGSFSDHSFGYSM